MVEQDELLRDGESSLGSRVESVLFVMNCLLSIVCTVVLYRIQRVTSEVFEDFEVEIPQMTQLALEPWMLYLIPCLFLITLVIHFQPFAAKPKIAGQGFVAFFILFITSSFLLSTLPLMYKLIKSLE